MLGMRISVCSSCSIGRCIARPARGPPPAAPRSCPARPVHDHRAETVTGMPVMCAWLLSGSKLPVADRQQHVRVRPRRGVRDRAGAGSPRGPTRAPSTRRRASGRRRARRRRRSRRARSSTLTDVAVVAGRASRASSGWMPSGLRCARRASSAAGWRTTSCASTRRAWWISRRVPVASSRGRLVEQPCAARDRVGERRRAAVDPTVAGRAPAARRTRPAPAPAGRAPDRRACSSASSTPLPRASMWRHFAPRVRVRRRRGSTAGRAPAAADARSTTRAGARRRARRRPACTARTAGRSVPMLTMFRSSRSYMSVRGQHARGPARSWRSGRCR